MTANTKLIQAIADVLIGEYGEDATEWLEGGGRANVERVLAEWSAAIEEGRWIERIEDVLVLRALRHESHWVEVLGGPDTDALIREFVDEDWRARGVETATRIGEVFAHALLRGDTGEPFESIESDWREHGDAIRGEDDEQPWNAERPLSGVETRVEVCLAEARYIERRVPFVDLPGSVRRAKAAVDAGDESGWAPVADGPVFRYVRVLPRGGDGADDSVQPSASHALHRRARVCPRALGGARRGGAARPVSDSITVFRRIARQLPQPSWRPSSHRGTSISIRPVENARGDQTSTEPYRASVKSRALPGIKIAPPAAAVAR